MAFLVAPPSTTLYTRSRYSTYSQVYICYTESPLQVQQMILCTSVIPPDNTAVIFSLG